MTHLIQLDLSYELAAQGIELRNGKRLWLRDAYDWHQLAWDIFHDSIPPNPIKGRFAKGTKPEDQPKVPADFLTRLDQRPEGFRLLIVSPMEPMRPSWCPADCWRSRPIPESYFGRRRYAFQLHANPTKKVTALNPDGSPKKNSRRVPLRTREELLAWLQRKAEQGGFRVDLETVRTIPQGREHFIKPGARGTHTAVEFKGVLQVTDATKFRETFARGIGSAKAFAFGMLVLAPLSAD